jgi:hypothetical protein
MTGTAGARATAPAREERITSSTLMEAIASVEARYRVTEWEIDGIRFWPLARIRWFFALWESAYCAGPQPGGRSRLRSAIEQVGRMASGAIRCACASAMDASRNDRITGPRDVAFLSDGFSFAKIGGRWVERFCDPLIGRLQARRISSVLLTPSHRYLRPRATPSVFIQPRIDLANLRGALRSRAVLARIHAPDYAPVRSMLASRGVDHPALSLNKIASDLARLRAVAHTCGRLLDRLRPRLALIVSYYSLEGMAFVLACRERGIRVVDLQHGVQGELHPAYGRLPQPSRDGHVLLPHAFWVWSEEEAKAVRAWAGESGAHEVVVGGNSWLEDWLGEGSATIADTDRCVAAMRREAMGRRIVLVTLQYGLDEAEQLQPLRELIRAAGDGWAWWVRLHPIMLAQRGRVRGLLLEGDGAVRVDEPTDLPLYGLLRHVDAHLTHSSSTVLEAIRFGVRSVVTSRYGVELFPGSFASGAALAALGGAASVRDALAAQAERRGAREAASATADEALSRLLRSAGLPREGGA